MAVGDHVSGRSDRCARQTDGDGDTEDHGIEPGAELSKLPSGAEPGGMVELETQCGFVTFADGYVSSRGADLDRDR